MMMQKEKEDMEARRQMKRVVETAVEKVPEVKEQAHELFDDCPTAEEWEHVEKTSGRIGLWSQPWMG